MFSRDVLLEVLEQEATDFGREMIPAALERHRVHAYMHRGYWADVGTVDSFYDANIMLTRPGSPFRFYDPRRPIYTHPRFLPGSRLSDCAVRDVIIAEGCYLDHCKWKTRSSASAPTFSRARRSAVRCCSAPISTEADDDAPARDERPRLGIGRDGMLDRVIVDKNARIGDGARLVNEAGVQHADGDGYFIRNGVIIVPKDGVIKPGTWV